MTVNAREADEQQRELWRRGAQGWERRRESLREKTAPVTRWLVDAIDPQPGQRVLELAAGPGETGLIAAQGPKAEELVGRLADQDVGKLGYYRFARGAVAGIDTLISRTGYTGEDGFELYASAAATARLWAALLEAGHDDGAQPIGLGARDTLRLEMKYALYGNDIDDTTNALEAGLSWVVKPAKGEFIGRAALEKVRAEGVRRKLVGIEMVDKAVARHGYPVLKDGRRVGVVTSGSYGPSVDRYIAMAYVETALAAVDTPLAVEIRGQAKAARVVRTPFHPSRVKKG